MRQQSNEFASQIRENVRFEEKRQLEKVNRLMQDEMFNWRQKQIEATEKDYRHCLDQIGEAHTAAERENAKQQKIDEQREKNRRIALKRGKIATEKIKSDPSKMKPTKLIKPVKEKKVIEHTKKGQSTPESSSSDTTTSSSSSSDSSVILVEKKSKFDKKVTIVPIPSKSNVSHKPSSSSKGKSPIKIMEYNPMRYSSANNSPADVSFSDSPASDTPPLITKVSDLLGRKPARSTALRSSPYIAKTYKLDKSPIKSRTTPKKAAQKPQINTVSTRLSRTIQTPTKTRGKSPMKVLPERKHFVPEFVRGKPATVTKMDSAIQTTPQRTSKVQFYDHGNRFSRQYDGTIDLEEKLLNVVPLNAWEEAKVDDEFAGAMRYV